MVYIFLSLAVAAFVALIKLLRIEALVADASVTARGAGAAMRSKELDEDQKERAVQSASLAMLRHLGLITLASVAAVGLSIAVAYGGVALGLFDVDALLSASVDWRFLVGATVLTIGALFLAR